MNELNDFHSFMMIRLAESMQREIERIKEKPDYIQVTPRGGIIRFSDLIQRNTSYLGKKRERAIREVMGYRIVYIVREGNEILYVGASNYDPKTRLRMHINGKSDLGKYLKTCDRNKVTVESIKFSDRPSMLAEESRLIKELQPKFNHDPDHGR